MPRLTRNKATANRVLNYLSAAYSWAAANGHVAPGYNPTMGIQRYVETKRERFLGLDELDRLGAAVREAETVGIPWEVDEGQAKAKHIPKPDERQTQFHRMLQQPSGCCSSPAQGCARSCT